MQRAEEGKKDEEEETLTPLWKSDSCIKQTLSGKHDAISISARVLKYLQALRCRAAIVLRVL